MQQPLVIERRCWTVAEAVAVIGLSTSMGYKLIKQNGFYGCAVYFGSRVFISKAKLEKYIDEHGEPDARD